MNFLKEKRAIRPFEGAMPKAKVSGKTAEIDEIRLSNVKLYSQRECLGLDIWTGNPLETGEDENGNV